MRRVPMRGALAGAATLALVAVLAALALSRDGGDRAADERRATPPPTGVVVPLLPMLDAASCRGLEVSSEPSRGEVYGIGLLERRQRGPDGAIPPPQGNAITWLPVRSFDPGETRYARGEIVPLHVVPSLGVSTDGRCDSDAGPGVCLVESGRYRCFSMVDVRAGRALTRIPAGVVAGIVPDSIGRVTLSAGGRTVAASVVDNVYQAELDVPAGARVEVRLPPATDSCGRALAPELLARVAALRTEPRSDERLPQAARDVLSEWHWQLDAIVEDRARFWGADAGVDFWVVPVAARGGTKCAPAAAACVVAVATSTHADAQCVLDDEQRQDAWRLTPLLEGHAAIYGIVPDGVTGVRVTVDGDTAEVEARENVAGGVLPFPYRDRDSPRVAYVRGQPLP
jgi:hypothetical protein